MLLVYLYRNSFSVIQHRDSICLSVDHNLHPIHIWITLLVISSIDNDFIKNLVESRSVRDIATFNALRVGVENKHWLGDLLRASDVCVGTEEDVLELSLLLVSLFYCLLFGRLLAWRCVLGGGNVGPASLFVRLLRRVLIMDVVLGIGVARLGGGVGAAADALGIAVEIHGGGFGREQ